jgi:microfibrillar-associated protein 1
VTIEEKEQEAEKERQLEIEKERLHAESKKQIKKLIQNEIAREYLAEKETDDNILCDFKTDDEGDQNEYEAWKLRELKRIKRDREEKEKWV